LLPQQFVFIHCFFNKKALVNLQQYVGNLQGLFKEGRYHLVLYNRPLKNPVTAGLSKRGCCTSLIRVLGFAVIL